MDEFLSNSGMMDLGHLSLEEKLQIIRVLKRDERLLHTESNRVLWVNKHVTQLVFLLYGPNYQTVIWACFHWKRWDIFSLVLISTNQIRASSWKIQNGKKNTFWAVTEKTPQFNWGVQQCRSTTVPKIILIVNSAENHQFLALLYCPQFNVLFWVFLWLSIFCSISW